MTDEDLKWEAIEPESECSDPSGHRQSVIRGGLSVVPLMVTCSHCGDRYTVITMPRERR